MHRRLIKYGQESIEAINPITCIQADTPFDARAKVEELLRELREG